MAAPHTIRGVNNDRVGTLVVDSFDDIELSLPMKSCLDKPFGIQQIYAPSGAREDQRSRQQAKC